MISTYYSTFEWSIILGPSDICVGHGSRNLAFNTVFLFRIELSWFRCDIYGGWFHWKDTTIDVQLTIFGWKKNRKQKLGAKKTSVPRLLTEFVANESVGCAPK